MENKSEAQVRLEKLAKLRSLGIDPYPVVTPEFQPIDSVREQSVDSQASTVGRISAIRSHGKTAFIDLVNHNHKLQTLFKQENLTEQFNLVDLLDSGDYLHVEGKLFFTRAGELTLEVTKFTILAKGLTPLPEHWLGFSDTEARYRLRSLDFKINPEARKLIAIRSKIISTIRQYLEENEFIEITTPVLQPIPGGAAAKPFTTHYNALDADFYLRISDELYLKRLIAGGFERVYEIGPDFRNEGISPMHNPEFTMCEFYWAFKSYKDLMIVTTELMRRLAKAVHGSRPVSYQGTKLDFASEFKTVKYRDIILETTQIDIDVSNTAQKLKEALKKEDIDLELEGKAVWAEMVDELFKKKVRSTIIQPTYVIDYPIALQPLAKKHRDNPNNAEQFQLIMGGGFELVKAYSELNDPIDQEIRFKEQMKLREQGWDEGQMLDVNYIESLKVGMPPTAGWGMGIDRLVMLLTDQTSIKEVIPFPTLRSK